jgi:hypothetical protein
MISSPEELAGMIKVGVIGYSAQKFDVAEATLLLESALKPIQQKYGKAVELISGLTDLGIPAVAYRLANSYGWYTAGVACSKAAMYECYPVVRKQIIGTEWGDESVAFISQLDILVRIGGGKQSIAEAQAFGQTGKLLIQHELPPLP